MFKFLDSQSIGIPKDKYSKCCCIQITLFEYHINIIINGNSCHSKVNQCIVLCAKELHECVQINVYTYIVYSYVIDVRLKKIYSEISNSFSEDSTPR